MSNYQPTEPGGYGQQPYAGQAYGGVQTQEHPQAQTTFILGIVGIFVGICAFIAWYMGGKAKKEIAAGAPYQWGGNLKTGYLLGKVFSIIYIVFLVIYIIAMIATVILAASSGSM
ncbi:hypothetical protein [Granulicoccus phenolivorans]|uniref:hypothetical protein n=1 Tax=Granulicoccus phenolivorans TaxID=266854 RepID=UPI000401733A|nr:hypothetical protein [Granulicoccus phenolivorans]